MYILIAFKFLCDLGLYYCVAGFFAVLAGAPASSVLAVYLLEGVAGTASAMLRKKRGLWILPLLLMAAGLFWPSLTLGGRIAALPAAVYVVWVNAQKRCMPEWGQQAEIFQVFWGVLLSLTVLTFLVQRISVTAAISFPVGLIGLGSCILLLRSLRHDPAVWRQPSYQIMNLLFVAGVILAAFLLSSRWVLSACVAALQWVYQHVIYPIIYVVGYLLLQILNLLVRFFTWLAGIFSGDAVTSEEVVADLSGAAPFDEEGATVTGQAAEYLIWILVAAAVIAVLVLLFRWLAGRQISHDEKIPDGPVRMKAEGMRGEDRVSRMSGSPEMQVRRQYRKFLLLCREKGVVISKDMTSKEVSRDCASLFDSEAVRQLREIYLEARYGGHSTKEGAARAKDLYRRIRHSADNN